jgi:hypothetical protein
MTQQSDPGKKTRIESIAKNKVRNSAVISPHFVTSEARSAVAIQA